MRVGLTVYGTLEERSGGFRYDRKLIEQFRRAGDTVETIELPWRAYHRGLLDNVSLRLRDRLDVDVDVMLQDELAHPSLVYTNRHLPYPIVTVVHHLRASERRQLSGLYRAVERRYLASVDGAVCNSTVTHDVVTGLGVDTESTVVAPPAGDRFDPDIEPAEIERRARRRPLQIVFVGNIAPRKGLDTLVDGLAQADTDAELTVVGRAVDEAYAASVRRQISDHGLASRVQLAGELPDTELATVLRQSHVLAVPSRYEGFGIVYLEGMSFGLPAIASVAGGATDIVTEGETGIPVDPDDPAAIAEAVTRLGTDTDRLARMGHRARERYEQHPDWETTAFRVRELLATVASTAEATV
jgi:glycosyltransferase involved in cell wall biosynthesis